jgi:hypothetical protein
MKVFSLVLLVVVLLFIPVALLLRPEQPVGAGLDKAGVERLLPTYTPGWNSEPVALGSTEATSESALKTLKLDAFAQRCYKRGKDEITVYIAYWKPGTMDTRLVASHTPDRCWVENGWACQETRNAYAMEMDGLDIVPVQYRVFNISGHDETVLYWLMVNGQRYDFGDRLNSYPSPWRFMRDFFKEMARGRPEHFFVRISSNMSEGRLLSEPLMRQIMEAVEPTGVCRPKTAPADQKASR